MKTLLEKTQEGLSEELKLARTHLKELEFKRASNQLKNVRDIRKTKLTIARIETFLSSKK
ncbi:50S ribosomal protein L29 [Candidatus Uhrbacteria bacterium]|nr:50S ribosomal protein L29 [Candidatus Uhrbacteria bacterium]